MFIGALIKNAEVGIFMASVRKEVLCTMIKGMWPLQIFRIKQLVLKYHRKYKYVLCNFVSTEHVSY